MKELLILAIFQRRLIFGGGGSLNRENWVAVT